MASIIWQVMFGSGFLIGYDGFYYEKSPYANPKGPDSGTSKVLRGGNWYYKAYYMRTTYRFNEKPNVFNIWQGFRCAKDLN